MLAAHTNIWAIVPLKSLEQAKQRLANVLSQEERRALMLAMARDVLNALMSATQLAGVLIVSRTPEADALSQAFGTERFAESPDANLAEALTQAAHYLSDQLGATGAFIVPADVPLITAEDVDQVLISHQSVTVIPDDENVGTNGLILSPVDAIDLLFDGKSFKPHVEAAERAGITPTIMPNPGFALDIDRPKDLMTLLAEGPHSQTGTYLDKSGIAARLQVSDNRSFSADSPKDTG